MAARSPPILRARRLARAGATARPVRVLPIPGSPIIIRACLPIVLTMGVRTPTRKERSTLRSVTGQTRCSWHRTASFAMPLMISFTSDSFRPTMMLF
eukprot:5081261-Pyramimonas_sp.AAC.1